ncbi:MAG TPA: BamA/TamA family outer membrane protein [Polyangiaceae bacterium]|nr:BamA/TamA family outer membrane protein [Polyangiaceae bacterium]
MNRWLGLFFGAFAVSLLAAGEGVARAQIGGYSALEQSVVDQELSERKLVLEPEPEGKWIEAIEVVPIEVFDERDPVPDFVNVFHTTTRKQVIARELLFSEGTRYDTRLVDETARNLRDLIQLSIVLIVPAQGSAPDRVRLLVITKDVWSLRLNWLLQSSNAHINFLALNPSEENVLGTHAIVAGLLTLDPARYSLGGSLGHRRLFGSHVEGDFQANVFKNRDTGANEGSFGEFRYGQPLYSLDTKWAWGTSFLWNKDVYRHFIGVDVASYDAAATRQDDHIPVSYNRDQLYGGYQVVRSFGRVFKYDFYFGVEAARAIYRTLDLSAYDPRARAQFIRDELPVSDQRVSPFVQLRAHRTDYSSLIEVETLGLQENFSRGYDLLLKVYPASSAVGSTRSLLGSLAEASYTFPLGDGLIRPLVQQSIQYASENRDDALFESRLHVVSPRFGLGRIVLDGQFEDHFRNYFNTRFLIGGDNRLRGYAVGAFQGANELAASAELRTTSVDILSAQVGAAAFYDVGDANDRISHFQLKQDAGLGLRILFPEFDRIVFRADWGFPVSPGYATFPGAFFVSFAQAFPMPAVAPPDVLTATL